MRQQAELDGQQARIARLRAQLAKLRRLQFGRSSEKLDAAIAQLELALKEEGGTQAAAELPAATGDDTVKARPARRPLPAHLPRDVILHKVACVCPACGGTLRPLGEDVTEVLDCVPASFRVTRHVRPKFSRRPWETITQAPASSLPIRRGRAGAGLLAHVLIAKFYDHTPLYRQSEIYAREGVGLERSTLADWVGQDGMGSGITCWRRLRNWHEAGVWDGLHRKLLRRLRAADRIDWRWACIDSASLAAKRGVTRRSRT